MDRGRGDGWWKKEMKAGTAFSWSKPATAATERQRRRTGEQRLFALSLAHTLRERILVGHGSAELDKEGDLRKRRSVLCCGALSWPLLLVFAKWRGKKILDRERRERAEQTECHGE